MKVIDMPASVPSIAARGVYLRMVGPMKAPIRTITPMMKAQARPACQARIAAGPSPIASILEVDRQHDDEDDDEHVRHARAVRHRRHVAPPLLLREPARRDRRNRDFRSAARCRAPAVRARRRCRLAGIWTTKRQSVVRTITLRTTLVKRPKKPFQSPGTHNCTTPPRSCFTVMDPPLILARRGPAGQSNYCAEFLTARSSPRTFSFDGARRLQLG